MKPLIRLWIWSLICHFVVCTCEKGRFFNFAAENVLHAIRDPNQTRYVFFYEIDSYIPLFYRYKLWPIFSEGCGEVPSQSCGDWKTLTFYPAVNGYLTLVGEG